MEGQVPRYKGLFGTVRTIAAEEGTQSLFAGLSAGLQRQMIFSGLRVGLYFEIRNWITGPLQEGQFPTLIQKIKTAIISGSIAITVANPCDVVKIKLQSQGRLMSQGIPPQYKGSLHCYRSIIQAEGLVGLWSAYGFNVVRNSIINAAELASYDQYKQTII